jgi:hypothetical protein
VQIRRIFMTRYSHRRWLASLGGLVAAGVVAVTAAPTEATLVCPKGSKPPSSYCTNVKPTATTGNATNVTATGATLNGLAGPNWPGGDITQYTFQYGPTRDYGNQTPPGTIGACPFGTAPPSSYCNVPPVQHVSARISGLVPCTLYHYQLVASNADGTASGGDRIFTTAFAPPLTNVQAPSKVRAGRTFKVQFTLRYAAAVKIVIKKKKRGASVATYNYGTLPPGRYKERITAPRRRGNYFLQVIARMKCGKQTVTRRLKVR